jgi:hypothetical protein
MWGYLLPFEEPLLLDIGQHRNVASDMKNALKNR